MHCISTNRTKGQLLVHSIPQFLSLIFLKLGARVRLFPSSMWSAVKCPCNLDKIVLRFHRHFSVYSGVDTWISGAGSIIKARKILTKSSKCLSISCRFLSKNVIILLSIVQYKSRISSQFSTIFSITLGFCPGLGRNFSGNLSIPSKSTQFVRSLSAYMM